MKDGFKTQRNNFEKASLKTSCSTRLEYPSRKNCCISAIRRAASLTLNIRPYSCCHRLHCADVEFTTRGTGPSVDWHSIQHLLEYATPDVAIFLDCCFAASADKRSVDGTVEILAACCQQTTTVGISPFSFTNRLTEVLRDSKSYPLTIAMLHAKLVNFRGAQRIKKLLKTPIHSIMSDRERPSIRLCPVSPKATPTLALSGSDLSSDSSLPEYGPIIDLSNPPATRVLLKLCLKSPIQSISDWQGWLTTHMPTEVIDIKMIKLEGLWGSHSSLALFSIPISVWDLLPPTLAYQQVGLITTSNLVEAWPSFSGIQSNMHTTSQDHPQIFPTQISDLAVASEDLDSVPTTLARSTSSVVSEDSLQDRLSDFALTKGSSTPTTLALKPESKASKETPISLSYYDERYFVESTRLPAPQDRDRIPTRKGQAAMDMEEPTNMKPRGSRYSEGSMRLSAPRYKDSNLNAEEEEEPAGNMEEPMGNFMGRSRKA